MRTTVDLDALRAADLSILVDPMWGAGSGWLSRLLAGGRIRVNEIHQERNPYFGGVNPEPIRPNVDEALSILAGGGYDLGLLLDGDADRAGAADERGTFIHQLQVTGLLMYYLAEHRGLREPVVVSINNTSMAARLGERYGIETFETPVGFKFIGPKMIETGAMMGAEESGGFGFGMHLPERDGVYADLLLLDLFLREKAAGRWPVSRAIERFHEIAGPSWYRRIDVHFERAAYARAKRHLLVELREQAPAELAGSPVVRTLAARHERRIQVLAGRRVMAARAGVGHRAARPRLHRGDDGGDPGCDAGGRRATGPRRMSGERARDPASREAVGPRADLGPHRPICRQGPRHRGGQAAVAPAPPGQGRIDLSSPAAGCACTSRTRRARSRSRSSSRATTATCRPGGSIATRRSSGPS